MDPNPPSGVDVSRPSVARMVYLTFLNQMKLVGLKLS